MKILPNCLFIVAMLCLTLTATSQYDTYILNGSARQDNCNCYTLTKAVNDQSGSVWNASKIDLSRSFDFVFNVYLGCKDGAGADGIVFILQPLSTSIGAVGQGMGFYGVNPSVGIALDTWQNKNLNDPPFDHISFQLNGNSNHSNDLVPPVQASGVSGNIEDCQWHSLRISWDAGNHWLRAYFDGLLRLQAQVNLVSKVFNNDPMVYWGFGAATGAYNNEQKFCTVLNPAFVTNLGGNGTCLGNTVSFQNQSQSFAPIKNHFWDFGDGRQSTESSPSHQYTTPGIYTVKLVETGLDGCDSDTARKTIEIGDFPVADFEIYDTCAGQPPRIIDRSFSKIGVVSKWNWKLDGQPVSNAQSPLLNEIGPGPHIIELTVTTNYGCVSSAVTKELVMAPSPIISASAVNGCVNVPVSFQAQQLDNTTVIDRWKWNFDNGVKSLQQNPTTTFYKPGYYNVEAVAVATNGCTSKPAGFTLFINQAVANAGNDTVVLGNQPFQMNASGGSRYYWSPGNGLSDTAFSSPVALINDDATYRLSVVTEEGCTDEDEIHLKVFRGSDIKMPGAFTPNDDGLNDILRPSFKGIKRLESFTIYNRWGQQLFSTSNIATGWDGRLKGQPQASGVYVWNVRARDYSGKILDLKGTVTLIR